MKKLFLSLLAVIAMALFACASKEKKGTEPIEAATPVLARFDAYHTVHLYVSRDVAPRTIVGGAPAKQIKQI